MCEQAGLFQRALEHYTDLVDIKRAITNPHLLAPPDFLVTFFGTLSVENSVECLRELLNDNLRQNLHLVVTIAAKYHKQLEVNKLCDLFESFKSNEGLFYFLGSIVRDSQDPEVHFKYIQAAARTGQVKEVERMYRESTVYDPKRVKEFFCRGRLTDRRTLVIVCDRLDFIDGLVDQLTAADSKDTFEALLAEVNPVRQPVVLDLLRERGCAATGVCSAGPRGSLGVDSLAAMGRGPVLAVAGGATMLCRADFEQLLLLPGSPHRPGACIPSEDVRKEALLFFESAQPADASYPKLASWLRVVLDEVEPEVRALMARALNRQYALLGDAAALSQYAGWRELDGLLAELLACLTPVNEALAASECELHDASRLTISRLVAGLAFLDDLRLAADEADWKCGILIARLRGALPSATKTPTISDENVTKLIEAAGAALSRAHQADVNLAAVQAAAVVRLQTQTSSVHNKSQDARDILEACIVWQERLAEAYASLVSAVDAVRACKGQEADDEAAGKKRLSGLLRKLGTVKSQLQRAYAQEQKMRRLVDAEDRQARS